MAILYNNLKQIEAEVTAWTEGLQERFGEAVTEYAREEAPVSANNEDGHIHLRDRIHDDWEGDDVVAYSDAEYSAPVNFGRLDGSTAPQPYWTRATKRATDEVERKARRGMPGGGVL